MRACASMCICICVCIRVCTWSRPPAPPQLHPPHAPAASNPAAVSNRQLPPRQPPQGFTTCDEFLQLIAQARGKLRRGGVPDMAAAARIVLQVRGKRGSTTQGSRHAVGARPALRAAPYVLRVVRALAVAMAMPPPSLPLNRSPNTTLPQPPSTHFVLPPPCPTSPPRPAPPPPLRIGMTAASPTSRSHRRAP